MSKANSTANVARKSHLSLVKNQPVIIAAPISTAEKTHFAVLRNETVEVVCELSNIEHLEEFKIGCRARQGQIGSDKRPMQFRIVKITSEHAAKINAEFAQIAAELQIIDDSLAASKEGMKDRIAADGFPNWCDIKAHQVYERKCEKARDLVCKRFDMVRL